MAWAASVMASLERDGRRAQGGWPGTVREALHLVETTIGVSVRLTAKERADLASIAYDAARRDWLARREIDDSDE